MKQLKTYCSLDGFRLVAAMLVIAIHTAPLATYSEQANFVLTQVLARVAVPFFLMSTGYFVIPKCLSASTGKQTRKRTLGKLLKLYVLTSLLYFPLSIYAGYLPKQLSILAVIKLLAFDGLFYHLWYLPAAILGLVIVIFLLRRLSLTATLGISSLLYVIGLLGDSYYGLTAAVPVMQQLYQQLFLLFSYTRNGFFLAPLFLVLGYALTKRQLYGSGKGLLLGVIGSLAAMSVEGVLLQRAGLQRHSSMYLLLPLVCVLLFQLLLRQPQQVKHWRRLSMTIYLLHPLVITVVYSVVKRLPGLGGIAVNSLLHYLVICLLSVLVSEGLLKLLRTDKPPIKKGRAWIELDNEALAHNVQVLKQQLPAGCQLMPAIKANAYGHGDVLIAKELNKLGIRHFCVATIQEGIALRKQRIKGDILILGYTHPQDLPLLRRFNLIQTVVDSAYGELLSTSKESLRVHVKVDTGMHRLGIPANQSAEIEKLLACPQLQVEGVFSHLCMADAADQTVTRSQIAVFSQLTTSLKRQFPRLQSHLLSSYGILRQPQAADDFVRPGIALFGLLSTTEDTQRYGQLLKPVLTLKTRIARIEQLQAGESAGYGLQFTAARLTCAAVVTIGYGDGIPRTLSNGNGHVLIRGQKVPMIGRICMDQLLVDVTDCPDAQQHDVVVLIGEDGRQRIEAGELAQQAGTITNEILSRLGSRLVRVKMR